MNNKRLLLLLSKYQDNVCSKEEIRELEQWYTQLNTSNQSIQDSEADTFSTEMLSQFRERLGNNATVIPFYRKLYFRIAAAASIIIVLSTAAYLQFFNTGKQNNNIVKNTTPLQQDIASPKVSKATITLANGQTVLLDNINTGTSVKQGDVNMKKTADGQIIYNGTATEAVYNILFNPRGSGVVHLKLNDGTEIWLNSETRLTYPVAFTGKERKVEIDGEAYFEVAKNASMPFKVNVAGRGEVEVLGTHFNVNAYSYELTAKTTLLEGAVKISALNSNNKMLLMPGQQAQLLVNSNLLLNKNPDIDEIMAWKNGKFQFGEAADIETIMRQIARWYDVEVEYKGMVTEHIGGTISRDVNVTKVFEMLEMTGSVKFQVNGKKVIVMPQKK